MQTIMSLKELHFIILSLFSLCIASPPLPFHRMIFLWKSSKKLSSPPFFKEEKSLYFLFIYLSHFITNLNQLVKKYLKLVIYLKLNEKRTKVMFEIVKLYETLF
uniref:Uncharacterized protein n=1 Tax=Cacopsylla melanoneura TaxID=428564 RepID=A0A8D8TPX8_9HEMI